MNTIGHRVRSRIAARPRQAGLILHGVFFGMSFYGVLVMCRLQRGDHEPFFVSIRFGDLLRAPILPPYYNHRLLPYVVPLGQSRHSIRLRQGDLAVYLA